MRRKIALYFLVGIFLGGPSVAEPPNPFGGNVAPPPGSEEDDVLNDPVEGFKPPEPPQAVNPPPLPSQDSPSVPPSRPGPTPRALKPPPKAPTTLGAKPAPPPDPKAAQATGGKQAMKLVDYLELDPSIRGLQVQNFDFADREIKDLVTLISKWTGKNFILDNKVRGKITIVAPSQVTLQEAYQAFLSALEANGLTTIKSGKFVRIIDAAEARRAPVETFAGDYAPNTDQFITRIFQLQYISAEEVNREFRELVSRSGRIFAYTPTNTIIITDTGSNIRRMEDILRVLDVKSFETSLHVLRIKYSSAKQIADMLDQIYGEGPGATRGGSGTAASRFRRNILERTRGGGVITKVIPDEQTNSLIVLANSSGFETLVKLVAKIDVRVTDTGRIHVYYCEYAKAEDLASTLAALSGTGGGGKPSSSKRNTKVTTAGAPPVLGLAGGGQSAGPVTAELGEGVRITADAPTNSLVITASSTDYQTLKRVIRKLDIPRLQVFVETAILEVILQNKKEMQANLLTSANGLLFSGGSVSDPEFIKSVLGGGGIPEGATIPIFAGKRVQVNIGGSLVTIRSFMGILRFLTSTTNTSVLSTPQILALDNEKSVFKVQDDIPVQSGVPPAGLAAGTGVSANVAPIERMKTGIEINLIPHVNASSRTIRLEIEQKVESVAANVAVPSALKDIQRAKTTRETNTNVVVRDGDYVMLGGLMSDRVDEINTKVPLLGDIPILGWLFKKTSNEIVKTNLIILLHPRIIGTSVDGANLISEKFKKRKEFLDRFNGGEDQHDLETKDFLRQVEGQKRRGKGISLPSYRNDEEEEESAAPPEDESKKKVSKVHKDTAPKKEEKVDLLPETKTENAVPEDLSLPPETGAPTSENSPSPEGG